MQLALPGSPCTVVRHPFLCPHSSPCAPYPPRQCRASSLSVGIIFTSYALQVKYQPFLPPNNAMLGDDKALTSGMKLVYVR